ncbi:MAG: DNA translocase FtsK [Leptospiraceae bacterium]|nr:MAG: DNA translocase FtsK [Leptospiraceae bacterium]
MKVFSKKPESMEFLKNIFKNKIEIQEKLENKPPWIQKVEIIEEDSDQSFPRIIEENQENEDFKIKSESDINSNNKNFYNNFHNEKLESQQFYLSSDEKEQEQKDIPIPKKIKIYFDSYKDRFLFEDEEHKKKINLDNNITTKNAYASKDLLDELELDPEIYKEIQFSNLTSHIQNINHHNSDLKNDVDISNQTLQIEELSIEIEEDNKNTEQNSTNHINKSDLENINNEETNILINPDESQENIEQEPIEEANQTINENYNVNQKNEKQNEIDQNFDEPSPIKEKNKDINSLYSLNPEYIQKKLKELQEQIISSDPTAKPYRLSLRNLKLDQTSFQISGISIQQEIQENWQKLEQVLNDYGIKGQVVGATRGPMITMYEIRLEPGVRVNRIINLQDEIRMNLAALSVRIVAPIPGKTTIGIEIPNKTREFVILGELVHKDSEFFSKKRDINIPLGKDVAGKTRYIDLTRLPHLLIAGATGSGKSVFLNSIIASLLYQYSPEQIRFLMIDPKMVELKLYEGIPHLLYPVIIDVKLAEKALHWAVNEMENRYKLFSLAKCRDIRSYNEKIKKGTIKGNHIPYIVIIIDELSDLMMVSAKEVEESIIRLTQKARAVGIHMILATQRPSVDVITALIKANCPARISFQVAQKVDSRIILDINGAETLLGKGDMLYRSPASTLPIRIQAPNITEEEIETIVKETQNYDFLGYIDLPEEQEIQTDFGFNHMDEELIGKAWKIILETGKTSTSYIQRRLRIGYNRAANIMEKLEEMGYLSPAIGNKPREILKRE